MLVPKKTCNEFWNEQAVQNWSYKSLLTFSRSFFRADCEKRNIDWVIEVKKFRRKHILICKIRSKKNSESFLQTKTRILIFSNFYILVMNDFVLTKVKCGRRVNSHWYICVKIVSAVIYNKNIFISFSVRNHNKLKA